MFAPPPRISSRVVARLPDDLRVPHPDWTGPDGQHLDSFLEGPAFDRKGILHFVDVPNGRILRLVDDERIETVAHYDGEPNGLKFHADGRLFVADYKYGLMVCDVNTGRIKPLVERPFGERFKGLNDLVFDRYDNLYFTDQGASGLHDPTGRLFCLTASGTLRQLLGNIPSPNGVAISPDGRTLFLAVTRANAIWRMPLSPDGSIGKTGVFLQLTGSLGGPDGIAVDSAGNLVVAHIGLGAVWLFSRLGEPLLRIDSSTGLLTSNIAYGGPEGRTLYITESETGTILAADVTISGSFAVVQT